jgi:nitrogen fixation NifU-like protein
MLDVNDLYQEIILDHNKAPRNFGQLSQADREAVGHNPLCGDKVTVYLRLDQDRISDIKFEGSGCAISTASASLMTESLKGKTRGEVETLFRQFHNVVTGKLDAARVGPELGKLVVFQGVSDYPIRVKCATLAWHTLQAALESKQKTVSTE